MLVEGVQKGMELCLVEEVDDIMSYQRDHTPCGYARKANTIDVNKRAFAFRRTRFLMDAATGQVSSIFFYVNRTFLSSYFSKKKKSES